MKRSKHSLSHFKLATGNCGNLIPVSCYEVLPGDSIQDATSLLIRVNPLNTPVMHPVHVRIHKFFCPTRIIWTNFQNFITGGSDGMDATVAPTITINPATNSLADYLGVTPGTNQTVSALPFRAYQKIFTEYYRDQDLTTAPVINLGDGADATTDTNLQNVAWEKDYYTSARPWTQKGPAVTLPLGTSAPVKPSASRLVTGAQPAGTTFWSASAGAAPGSDVTLGVQTGTGELRTITNTPSLQAGSYYPGNLYADLTSATAATVNQLRYAMAVMRYEEARARYGSRYTEYLRYLGIRSSDARLQRPEYLGGGKQTIQFSEVLQTGVNTSGTPLVGVGSMAGHGIGAARSNRYRKFFEEHGYVITLLSVLPKTIYANGTPKMFLRTAKEDYWQKELEHVGQEQILNKETYAAHSAPTGVFGYQDRYDSYRRLESSIAGDFRGSLNTWHYARIFAGDTALNDTFVKSNPTTRVYQAPSSAQLQIMAMHSIQARRLVSKVGTSSIL